MISKDKSAIVASDNVLDRTMLESSLLSFGEDYVKNVMHKDVLNMISEVQKAGVIIKKHEIDIDHSALGSYENHTLELKPIDGAPSTIRFRIPVVDDDGNLSVNATKYRCRLQRVD